MLGCACDWPPLAETLEQIAKYGAEVFYKGVLAKKVVKAVKEVGGILSLEDLASYAGRACCAMKQNFETSSW